MNKWDLVILALNLVDLDRRTDGLGKPSLVQRNQRPARTTTRHGPTRGWWGVLLRAAGSSQRSGLNYQ